MVALTRGMQTVLQHKRIPFPKYKTPKILKTLQGCFYGLTLAEISPLSYKYKHKPCVWIKYTKPYERPYELFGHNCSC